MTTTDDHYDGEVHGLLAAALDENVPVVNLVPGAVDGYRRHRKRARVLGAAGGALAVAGVVTAGTALAAGSGKAVHPQSTANQTGNGHAAQATLPECTGVYFKFGTFGREGIYSTDQQGLAAACSQDLTTLRQLTGDASLKPVTEDSATAAAQHDIPAGATPPRSTRPLVQTGFYEGRINRVAYRINILVTDKIDQFGGTCKPSSCPPNVTLADGRSATVTATGVFDALVIHYDATHTVTFNAALSESTSSPSVPFDYRKLIADPAFAQLMSADVHTLDVLTHPA